MIAVRIFRGCEFVDNDTIDIEFSDMSIQPRPARFEGHFPSNGDSVGALDD